MGFKSVYQCLTDVFPQVDSRILKAVAIENSKDVDAAVEVVLTEILPLLTEKSENSAPPRLECSSSGSSDEGGKLEEETNLLRRRVRSEETAVSFEPTSTSEQVNNGTDAHQSASSHIEIIDFDADQLEENTEGEELILLGSPQHEEDNLQTGSSPDSQVASDTMMHDGIQLYANAEQEVPSSGVECQHKNFVVGQGEMLQVPSTSSIVENGGSGGSFTDHHIEKEGVDDPVNDYCFDVVDHRKNLLVEECSNDTLLEVENSMGTRTLTTIEDGNHSESSHTPTIACENAKSSYDNKIELLEEMIEAAKDNKKTLFSAMEVVMKTMKQVELEEKAAERAKEEAARGGLDILNKIEEIKQMLVHAKQANDMHAGEVYGEKAILATEARELQGRLLNLADERDSALSVLDEMNRALEARLAAAEEMRKAAEQEKWEKEESLRSALAEQQAIMEKVVQESNILKLEAEENSKLREFLVDRGRVVDTLQGEISVICQDVKLLKEKFDDHLPLSKSISSSQTSCILASGSPIRSATSDLVPMQGSKSSKDTSPTSSFNEQLPNGRREAQGVTDAPRELLDEEWDFLDA